MHCKHQLHCNQKHGRSTPLVAISVGGHAESSSHGPTLTPPVTILPPIPTVQSLRLRRRFRFLLHHVQRPPLPFAWIVEKLVILFLEAQVDSQRLNNLAHELRVVFG